LRVGPPLRPVKATRPNNSLMVLEEALWARLRLTTGILYGVRELNLQEAYDVRPIRFLELWHESGWTLKVYGIAYGRERPREELVEAAKQIVRERLTHSTNDDNHYVVGFLGVHDGRGANFVYLDYWADENELHHHLYVSSSEAPASLEYITPTGVIACAWDVRVLSFERDAWVEAMLANPSGPDVEGYLARMLNEDA
jgi:hypothetical protein